MKGTFQFCLVLSLLLSASRLDAQSPPYRTILDGVYSGRQAERGLAAYTAHCGACHGEALEGVSAPELTGDRFVERWREAVLGPLLDFVRQRMPPRRGQSPREVTDGEYVDILSYILAENGYPAGPGELTAGQFEGVLFVGKSGPQPVPDGSHVLTVGCLARNEAGRWILSNATEPVRTATESPSSSEQLRASSERALGALTFRVTDLIAVPDFEPEAYLGQKMQAKGYLVRQPNAERISLSAMEGVGATCGA